MHTHNMRGPRRSGFTVLEVMVSMLIFLVVLATTANIFKTQTRAVTQHAGRLDAQQNARFALSTLERELRMGGVGLAPGQPALVQAGPLAVTFNTNLVAADEQDFSAVYINRDADPRTVGAFPVAKQMNLPGTNDIYPDTTYELSAGVQSRAETISYWLSRDSTSGRSDEYIMWRRVNHAPPVVLARGVLVGPNDTVFQFFKLDTTNTLQLIPGTRLPATHVAKRHRAPDDTGHFALVDSIRAVRVRIRTLYRDRHGTDAIREYGGRVTVLNAGVAGRATCGEAPLGVTPTVTAATNGSGTPYVMITWSPSTDENGGEKDVEQYAVYRRPLTENTFGEPIVAIPAGEESYSYTDYNVVSGEVWVYGVAAIDCTPKTSAAGVAPSVTVPGEVQVPEPPLP
jgi:prepilin-type N-terminal cleavage/methylation domain-containing protein